MPLQRQLDAQAPRHWTGYAWAVAVVALTTALGWPLHHKLAVANTNVLMLYLLGVVWVAMRYSRGAAIAASMLAVLAFDVNFVEPYYRLTVHDPQYIVTFAVMLLTAATISTLAHHLRAHERAARQAWERVEEEYLRNTLLSGVSHELRTPLAGITGAASVLAESGANLAPQTREEMLRTVLVESERMDRLINNLLDMTRLESGGLVVKKEWQPVQDVIGSALTRVEHRLRGRHVTTRVPDDLPLVQIDEVLIEQVLMNLLDNVVEYAPPGTAIQITASRDAGVVAIEVADDGPGLPPGSEQRVFEKFFRGGGTGSNRRGIGLGLAICRGIVEAHGGVISARNRDGGGGAVFRFTIPATEPPPQVGSRDVADVRAASA